ncbi:MAG: glycoside hydrolase family 38 C-terminal domain-containing protein [Phycisphaerales bacterium]
MLPPLQYSALGFETFADDVLRPAVTLVRHPLRAAIAENADADRDRGRGRGRFQPVDLGHRWGPVWSTAWFRLTGTVPPSMRGRAVSLRFSSGTEATLWRDGVPTQGFDPYRDTTQILARAKGNERIEFLVEAACNLPLGISTFWWDHPELHARWKEAKPGRLEACELVVVDEDAWRFVETWNTLRKTLLALPGESPRAVALKDGMRRIQASVPRGGADDVRAGMRRAHAALERLVEGMGSATRTTCVAVGHAHIDTAWLWPIRETRRKCVRTFANVLRLMERFPSFRFVSSQAQQYAWVEEDAPDLFAQIAKRVKEGRWETAGAMWVEPDCTCPSGESFVRQILHGTRWWRERFGDAAPQSFLYLPDTFGFPACLPQIGRLAGLDTFITNKMSWCESNRFPHVTFRWRGLDGTEILSHLTPGHNYNSALEPADVLAGERMLVTQDGHAFTGAVIPLWLQPFGFGDGGGGPTAEQIARAETMRSCEGLPRVVWDRVDRFCANLHGVRATLGGDGAPDLAAWDGELYLELHRGTYTSQAWIKRQNRLAESLLRDVEALACSAPGATARTRREVRDELDPLWKLVLLNQFHDILPGSSIREVYDDARADHVRVAEATIALRERLESSLAKSVEVRGIERPTLVRNPGSTARGGVVEANGALVRVDDVPSLGWAVVGAARDAGASVSVRATRSGVELANEHVAATIDRAGRIAELRSLANGRVANGRGRRGETLPMNQLVLHDDAPRRWEAWDIDRDYGDRRTLVDDAADVEVLREHGLRCEVRVRRSIGAASTLFQTYRLDADARYLEIRTEIDWHEDRTLLRALFPCDVRTTRASFGTQFGFVERPTHRNTSWEEARFEVPGHAWMDLSEPGFGVAVLDDGKYGRSAHDGTLGLSLVRAPRFPDPSCDRGEHAFVYAVMPHEGDWRSAGVDAAAEALREPLRAIALPRRAAASRARPGAASESRGAPFVLESPSHCRLHVAAWKPSEEGDARILRLVETRGGRGLVTVRWTGAVKTVRPVDLHERPLDISSDLAPARFTHARDVSTFEVRPFQIVTLSVHDG